MCARPQSVDGRPFIGEVAQVAGLFVCAGHGPWGISTGPASAAIAARAVLDGTAPPPELDAARPIWIVQPAHDGRPRWGLTGGPRVPGRY